MPEFKVISVEFVASYTSVSNLRPRPTPSAISGELVRVIMPKFDATAASRAMIGRKVTETDGKRAADALFPDLQAAITGAIRPGSGVRAVTVRPTERYYKPTSSGTHETVGWVDLTLDGGAPKQWIEDVVFDEIPIEAFLCVSMIVGPV